MEGYEEIKEKFKNKNWGDKELQLIFNFIEEFDTLFGQYVNREEIIKRIESDLEYINFGVDLSSRNALGIYKIKEKTINMSEKLEGDEEKIKSVFFHEMIHCITADCKNNINGIATTELDDEGNWKSNTRHGFNEGVTQYVTKIRHERLNPNAVYINSYPILTEQIENFVLLIGQEKFLDIFLNNSQNFLDEMLKEYDEYFSKIDLENMLDAFDRIWKEENNICKNKTIYKFFGITDKKLHNAKNIVIDFFVNLLLNKPVNNVDEINEIWSKIIIYSEQLSTKIDVKIYEKIYKIILELANSEIELNELLGHINSEELKTFCKQEKFIDEFKKLPQNERLAEFSKEDFSDRLAENGFDDDLDIFDIQLSKLSNTILEISNVDISYEFFFLLKSGLANIIIENNWNPNKIALESIKFGEFGMGETAFNLYETNINGKRYLGTYTINVDLGVMKKFTYQIPDSRKKEILQKYPELANALLLENQAEKDDEFIIGYVGDCEYINSYGEKGYALYYESKEDRILNEIRRRLERLETLSELGAPDFIFNNECGAIKNLIKELEKIEGKDCGIVEEIEQFLNGIDSQKIPEIIAKININELGLEILGLEKDYQRLDDVEKQMNEQLKEFEGFCLDDDDGYLDDLFD